MATLEPPPSLDGIMERAAVKLESVDVEMLGSLSVEHIIDLRRHAGRLFELARRPAFPDAPVATQEEYLKALERYWRQIIERLRTLHPEVAAGTSQVGLFFENQLPSLAALYRKYGKSVLGVLMRWKLGPIGAVAGDFLHDRGIVLLQARSDHWESLQNAIPPREWSATGLLGLSSRVPSLDR